MSQKQGVGWLGWECHEFEVLRAAEEKLSPIAEAMRSLAEATDRVTLHYEWYKWLTSSGVSGGVAQLPPPPEAEAWEIEIPDKSGASDGTRIKLRELRIVSVPEAMELFREMDSFYNAAKQLFEAAARIPVGESCKDRLSFPPPTGIDAGGSPQDRAYQALSLVVKMNSVRAKYDRVESLLRCVQERRKLLGTWRSPKGRARAAREYLDRHEMSIDEFVKWLEVSRDSYYNFVRGKGTSKGEAVSKIFSVLQKDIAPTRERLEQIRKSLKARLG